MKDILFITTNSSKADEVRVVLTSAKQLEIELPEPQTLDQLQIVEAKLKAALSLGHQNVLVEDTALCFEALNGLPGTLIKWFLERLGCHGLYRVVQQMENHKAVAKTIFGFAVNGEALRYAERDTRGTIVAPRGTGFGWDSVFLPEGSSKTFGEMEIGEKQKFSMRFKALRAIAEIIKGELEE